MQATADEKRERIRQLLLEHGPMTGEALSKAMPGVSPIQLWRLCNLGTHFRIQNCARYYLRYDVRRGNMLRLSPSILRDFLTFSLVYLPQQQVDVVEAGTLLANKFRMISLRKLGLGRQALLLLPKDLQKIVYRHCVIFLSGDIAYYLAHDTPRRHPELGTTIRGSDIDIVIVHNREADPEDMRRVERELLIIKKQYLITPSIQEEIDFIVKPVERMLEQFEYGTIHEMIASKILYESYFLMGRVDIYESLLKNMRLRGTLAKIESDFDHALSERKQTISKILSLPPEASADDPEVASLFFASQERLEFQ
ncbi:MAG: hypothetical protein WBF53_01090 [Litorimonas sp.]